MVAPQKICPPGTCKCDLIWEKKDLLQVKLRILKLDILDRLGGASPMTSVLEEKGCGSFETSMNTEGGEDVLRPQARGPPGPPKAGRGQEGLSSRTCRGNATLHPDFGLLAPRTVREQISVALSLPVCHHMLWHLRNQSIQVV